MTEEKKEDELKSRMLSELEDSEERLKILFEYAPDAYYLSDREGNFLDGNRAAEEMVGYKREELIGKNLLNVNLLSPEHLTTAVKLVAMSLLGQSTGPDEIVLVRKDGTKITVEIRTFPLKIAGKLTVLGIARDVTERKKLQEELADSEGRLKLIFEYAPDAFYLYDLEGNFVDGNRAAEEILGYKRGELIGKNFFKIGLILLEHMPKVVEAVARNVLGKPAEIDELTLKRKDGTHVTVEIKTFPIKLKGKTLVLGLARDITDRKKALSALADSQKCLINVLDSIDSLVYVADFDSYELLFINKYGRDIFGDVRGRICWQVIQEGQKGPCPFCTNDRLVSDTGIPTGVYQWEFQNTVNGRWYECRDQAIPWVGKALVRMEIATDITDRKRVENALRETSYNLSERVKELDCLKRVSDLIQKDGYPQDKLFQGIADTISSGWQYPEATCTRITVKGREFRTENFRETAWMQTSDIILHGERVGSVEVCYLQEKPEADEGPFLGEERNVINIIAERLSRYSERKQAEEQLKESEIRWSSLTENSYDTIMIVDSKSIIQFINKTTPPYTVEEIVGKPLYDYVAKEQHDAMRNSLVKVFKTGEPDSYEVSSIIPNLGTLWFSTKVVPIKIDGQVTRAILICADITDRKRMEDELRESGEKYRNIFENVTEGIFQSTPDGKYLNVNPAFARMFGFESPQEMISSVADIKNIYVYPAERTKIKDRILAEGFVRDYEAELRHRDGRRIWVR